MSQKIGFVGVGRMGANMARRLKEVGYTVSAVFDVRPEAAVELAKEIGCEAATKLARVTELSDVVITVVTDDKAMDSIYGKKGDSLLVGATGRVFINCATISPSVHVEVEKRAEAAGARSLEACMASSINQALQGTLYLMIGGRKEVFDRNKDLLDKLSKDGELLKYIGTSGKAAQVKALVNMVMNINTAGLAEGLGLADALGLDLKSVMEVFSQTGANSRVLVTDGEDMMNRDHSCFFSASHAAKDSGIALKLSQQAKLNLPLAKAAFDQYTKLTQFGLGDLDKSGIAELTFKGRGQKKKVAKAAKAAKPAKKAKVAKATKPAKTAKSAKAAPAPKAVKPAAKPAKAVKVAKGKRK
jgi:3-hydroxyisobutyrate dehydrogenase-like beta-hydroxyacid dehydrogenase